MRYISKIASATVCLAIAIMALSACDGGEKYEISSPDWLQSRIDSVSAANAAGELVIPDGLYEDVYTTGETDFTSQFGSVITKSYQVAKGEKWYGVFNLNINPSATNTYKNFALCIAKDVDHLPDADAEYGVIRYDTQPTGNSEWGDYIYREYIKSNLVFSTDEDAGIDKLGGKVMITVDRSVADSFMVTMNNGVVKKTYMLPITDETPMPNLNDNKSNTNIRFYLKPEGSYINFLQTSIVPVEGLTSGKDLEPVSMTVNAPSAVAQGTSMKDALGGVTASVKFKDDPNTVSVQYSDLTIDGDFTTPGDKEVIFIYNKTSKGNVAANSIIVRKTITVVPVSNTSPYMLGATDNSTGWWGAHTVSKKINSGSAITRTFINYSSKESPDKNFVLCLRSSDNAKEYGILRADNYGWGTGYAACTHSTSVTNWNTFKNAMNGATVTVTVSNLGNGKANVIYVMKGTNGKTYTQKYTGVAVEKDNLYYSFTVDKCHMAFTDKTTVGSSGNDTEFWGDHSIPVNIPSGTAYKVSFTNYTCGEGNWNNAIVALTSGDLSTEYGILRADNYGWGTGYAACTHSNSATLDGTWLKSMNGATIDLTVINRGDGKADVTELVHANNGDTYYQTYYGITVNKDNLTCRLTVDKCHLVFSEASSAKSKRYVRRR